MRISASQHERNRVRVSSLYLTGMRQADIAEEIGVNQGTVSRYLLSCREEWKTQMAMAIEERKAQELAKIDELEFTYWAAWRKSQEDAESQVTKMVGGSESPDKIEKIKKNEGQVGDPRYLAGVERCVEMRCKILGINAPVKIAPTDPTGEKSAENQVIIYIPSNGRERAQAEAPIERAEDE